MSQYHGRATLDFTQARIEAFNDAQGGGVLVKKAREGYSLFVADTGQPLARLRPTNRDDHFEVLWWGHRDKWEPIGDMGGVFLPLDEALEFIADDPMGCFWT